MGDIGGGHVGRRHLDIAVNGESGRIGLLDVAVQGGGGRVGRRLHDLSVDGEGGCVGQWLLMMDGRQLWGGYSLLPDKARWRRKLQHMHELWGNLLMPAQKE